MDDVVVTPHFASCTVGAYRRETEMAVDEVVRVLSGQTPRFVVNPEVLAQLDLQ
jgi:phosphoglycerate dehydrogenase-like enzyme